MTDVLALQLSDETTTEKPEESEESLPTSTWSVICTIPNDPS